jgi:hypothetical protein
MKKLILSLFTLATMAIVACGPSAEEKAAAEKAKQDSIANAEAEIARKATEDSLMAAQQKAMQDSIVAAQQKAMQDSIAMLKGSVKKMQQKETDTKKKEQKKQEDRKKQGAERG